MKAELTFTTRRGVPKVRYAAYGRYGRIRPHLASDGSVPVVSADASWLSSPAAKIAAGLGVAVLLLKLLAK
jgi:hypothetical protein